MADFLRSYLMRKVREHMDISTEYLTLFLNQCDTSVHEQDLQALEAISRFYLEHGENVLNTHTFYAARMAKHKG